MGIGVHNYGTDYSGTTAQRPGGPPIGEVFYDTTIGQLLVWNGTAWTDAAAKVAVTSYEDVVRTQLTAAQSGTAHVCAGAAAGTGLFVLPQATVGLQFDFVLGVAEEVKISPYLFEKVSLPSTGALGVIGTCIMADAVGESVSLYCAATGIWSVKSYVGTWAFVSEDHTGDNTLTATESGSTHTNTGDAGTQVQTLPVATVGLDFNFLLLASFEMQLQPNGTETIALPSTGVQGAAGKYITANATGEKARILCVTEGTWNILAYSGTWEAEA